MFHSVSIEKMMNIVFSTLIYRLIVNNLLLTLALSHDLVVLVVGHLGELSPHAVGGAWRQRPPPPGRRARTCRGLACSCGRAPFAAIPFHSQPPAAATLVSTRARTSRIDSVFCVFSFLLVDCASATAGGVLVFRICAVVL